MFYDEIRYEIFEISPPGRREKDFKLIKTVSNRSDAVDLCSSLTERNKDKRYQVEGVTMGGGRIVYGVPLGF